MKSMFVCLVLFVSTWQVAAEDWPQYMGPHRDGSVAAPGLFGMNVRLQRLWIQPLGSGFSSIVVVDGMLYTMYQDGDKDVLASFEAVTGKRRWTYAYGQAFQSVGSRNPGPMSTPAVDDDYVYGVGAYGELFSVKANTGELVWARNFVAELGAKPRPEGVATSPLILGDMLIVNVGDQVDKSTAAFNKHTGKLVWYVGGEKISFQSPAIFPRDEHNLVVGLAMDKFRFLEAKTGQVLYSLDSKEWIQAYAIGEDMLLAGHYHGFALYDVSRQGPLQVTERWNNENLIMEYNMALHHDGYLYGFKRGFLKCLDLATGERVWTSRDAGNGFAILVEDHLALMDYDGQFRIARATPKGYQERASLQVFDAEGLTGPSFANGVFYLRNHTNLAAVKVSRQVP